eukprot:CAMPEP_0170790356 /NCGR_PEP_ID=MMETSP0733-20121128/20359_1 /TAXON_ID=186038 /ORGANISM="Fragilariopsis kerguelensis, Strain L26-C5" /LENGTH=765 /DNA_ID=CAMNT_0011137797 /DNA_START=1 /DNA_END=2298 /DNA_ORIENTATION=-
MAKPVVAQEEGEEPLLVSSASASSSSSSSRQPKTAQDTTNTNTKTNTNTNQWILSEDEVEEAYGSGTSQERSRTQIALDPLQVCLYPTYLNLPSQMLQQDLRESLETLVSRQLSASPAEGGYGDDFVYFAFTDAQIDWYSGEESDPVCGSLDHVLGVPTATATTTAAKRAVTFPEDHGASPQAATTTTTVPCTCALYKGAVVLLNTRESNHDYFVQEKEASTHNNNSIHTNKQQVTPEALEPKIEAILQEELVNTLRDHGATAAQYQPDTAAVDTTGEMGYYYYSDSEGVVRSGNGGEDPFYTELKGAVISWNVAERQQGDGKLVLPHSHSQSQSQRPPVTPVELVPSSSSEQQQQQQQVRTSLPPTVAPVTVATVESDATESTDIDTVALPNGVEEQQQQQEQQSRTTVFATKAGLIVTCVVGGFLLLVLLVGCGMYVVVKRKRRHTHNDSTNRSYETTMDHHQDTDELEEDYHPRKSSGTDNTDIDNDKSGGDNATVVSLEEYIQFEHDPDHNDPNNTNNHNDIDEERGNNTKSRGATNSRSCNRKNSKKKRLFFSWSSSMKEPATSSDENSNSNDNDHNDTEGNEETSAAAQYESGQILDCISMGGESEWTIGTTRVTDGFGGGGGSSLGGGSSQEPETGSGVYTLGSIGGGHSESERGGTKTLAEMLAAKETFDRDRQITLQKDMLHSEWTLGTAAAAATTTGITSRSSSASSSGSTTHKTIRANTTSTAIFEQANGQGEELFLMPPNRSSASRRFASSSQ